MKMEMEIMQIKNKGKDKDKDRHLIGKHHIKITQIETII